MNSLDAENGKRQPTPDSIDQPSIDQPHTVSNHKAGWIKSTCAYCGVGCGIEAKPNAQGGLTVRGDADHPANRGKLCTKGMTLGDTVMPSTSLSQPHRLLHPTVHGTPQSWSEALTYVANQFQAIIAEHGREAIAFYVSGQLLIEDYYVANKLMKGFIGSSHIDTNSRLCMSSSVVGHQRAFGEDVVPGCYDDIDEADLVVLVGSNLAWCHPILYQRLRAAKAERNTHVIVIDPRHTATCELADKHLALRSGTDVALFNGLLAYLHQHGLTDTGYLHAHTEGFTDTLASTAPEADIDAVAAVTGLTPDVISAFYQHFAHTPRTVTVYSQGVNQSSAGSDKVNSIINVHLATGRIGQPGSGPFSVTGQPNAMGGREVGGLATMLAAHMRFDNEKHLSLIRDFWQTDTLATQPGLKAIDMFEAIESGDIKAIWIMATNPAASLPDSNRIQRILDACPLVVVSDCMADTDTLRHADVALPAQGWSEKSGTVTNSERCLSRQRRLLPTPGEGKPDWWIISEVAKRMGLTDAFDYRHEAEIFHEYATMTTLGQSDTDAKPDRQLNLSGLTHLTPTDYQQLTPQQWPVKRTPDSHASNRHSSSRSSSPSSSARLFQDGQFSTPSGRARCIPTPYRPPAATCDSRYPLLLNTGRVRDHWHTLTRTGLSPRLSAHTAVPTLTVHPNDAARYSLTPQHLVRIDSALGHTKAKILLSTDCAKGSVFLPFHWSRATSSFGHVEKLIAPHCDPLSGQPAFKHTPVQLTPLAVTSEALLITTQPITPAQWQRHGIRYWVQQTVTGGYLYWLYDTDNTSSNDQTWHQAQFQTQHQALTQRIQSLLATTLPASQTLTTQWETALQVFHVDHQRISAAFICDTTLTSEHLDTFPTLLGLSPSDPAVHVLLRRSDARSLCSASQQGPMVCVCKQLGRGALLSTIQRQGLTSLNEVRQYTQAGNGCGSCLPELQQIIDDPY